jgi:hypothetical protein
MIFTSSTALRTRFCRFAALWFSALILGGCAYHSAGNQDGGIGNLGIDNPVERKFTWFSYLDAADVRNSCAAGGPDQYRIVYNGQYYDHVRTYEVTSIPEPRILARARGTSGNLLNMSFGSFDELLGPWNFQRSESKLSGGELSQLRDLLHQSGFGEGNQAGLRLHSLDFYWLAAGCEDGNFHFSAWADKPGAISLSRTKFLDFLLKHDRTGIGYKPPHAVSYMEKNDQSKGHNSNYSGDFTITVHSDGIARGGI